MAITPLCQITPYDDPLRIYAALNTDSTPANAAALFDSASAVDDRGRYSFVAVDPYLLLTGNDNPFDDLAAALGDWRMERIPDLPPFQGGAAGYLGYELGRHLESLPAAAPIGTALPDMVMALYDTLVAFDHQTQQAWIVAVDVPGLDNRSPAARRIEAVADRIASASDLPPIHWQSTGTWQAEISRDDYESMIARTIDYIHAGDIFQANITQRFLGNMPENLNAFMLYRRLRSLSANPYNAFLQYGDRAIASASPELFLNLQADGHVITRPIKGTRPRGATPAADAALADALLASEKDHAENLMIVDLMRNDLGRVCRVGSIGVNELCRLETFANIHHLVSEVTGQLAQDKGPVNLLRAVFPGGSVTGAPKVRAMEIINELEPSRRGPYCGAVAWIGFDGAMHANIVIRTLVIDGDDVVAQAGGGIVADSDPAAEYQESLDKAAALLTSIDPKWREKGEIG